MQNFVVKFWMETWEVSKRPTDCHRFCSNLIGEQNSVTSALFQRHPAHYELVRRDKIKKNKN